MTHVLVFLRLPGSGGRLQAQVDNEPCFLTWELHLCVLPAFEPLHLLWDWSGLPTQSCGILSTTSLPGSTLWFLGVLDCLVFQICNTTPAPELSEQAEYQGTPGKWVGLDQD